MGAIKNAVYKVDNGVDFDEIHFKTKAAQVFCNDGKTVESQLAEVTNFIQGMTIGAIYPTLLNGWVNFNEGYSVVKYWKDTNNVVHIQGVIKGGTVNSVIFVLPAAYKPIGTIAVPVACTNTSGQWVVGVATISSLNGNVQMATNFTATHSINIAFKLK